MRYDHLNSLHVQADFLRKNPAATVPVLEVACDGKLLETIPDSLAIVKRLERGDLGGKSLIAEGNEHMAWEWVDRWSSMALPHAGCSQSAHVLDLQPMLIESYVIRRA